MFKKLFAALLAALCLLAFTGCDVSINFNADSTQAPTDTSTEAPTDTSTEAPTDTSTEAPTDASTEAPTEASTEAPTEATTVAQGGQYVNLDKMQFTVNGKVYTLGETTLQTLIDDGVPFEEEDLANANNNLNSNTESQNFGIQLGEYWTAEVSVLNATDENKPIAQCPLNSLYLPLRQDETQNVLTLSFPFDLTMEELKAQAGEPADTYEYVSEDGDYSSVELEYTRESTKYIGNCGYTFQFVNGEFKYVNIDWLP